MHMDVLQINIFRIFSAKWTIYNLDMNNYDNAGGILCIKPNNISKSIFPIKHVRKIQPFWTKLSKKINIFRRDMTTFH